MRATARQPVHGHEDKKNASGKRREGPGCGVTAHVMALTDPSIASRAADIISRMAWQWMQM
jgi:hypothetical protein